MKLRLCTLLLVGTGLLFPLAARAAEGDILLSPASGSFPVGDEFSVTVRIDPGEKEVNAAEADISFDSAYLSVREISRGGSAFSLWAVEPVFSNTDGTISFSGGTPQPFSTVSTIITIHFEPNAPGMAEVSFARGAVLVADGKGTDIYAQGTRGSYDITAEAPPPPPPPEEEEESVVPEPIPGGFPPEAPSVESSTHPDSERWYASSTVQFDWELPLDAAAVRLLISEEEDAEPSVVYEPPIETRTLENIGDGTWYFYAQIRNQGGWSESGKKKINIDTMPPEEFNVALEEETIPALAFETRDDLSGIEYYELFIGDKSAIRVESEDMTGGAFPVPPHEGGEELVRVVAYDAAGNSREAEETLTLPAVAPPATAPVIEEVDEEPFLSGQAVLTLIFVFATGVVSALFYFERKRYKKEHALILKELLDIREKSNKIFSAMQEEIEEQIHALNERPQLTPAERDVLERLHEVLDLSEELIDLEIDDVRRILRENE